MRFKKLISGLLSISMITAVSIPGSSLKTAKAKAELNTEYLTTTADSFTLADINADSRIDANDATLVLVNYSLLSTGYPIELTEGQQKAADTNGDGKIDASDATLILQYYSYLSTGGSKGFREYLAEPPIVTAPPQTTSATITTTSATSTTTATINTATKPVVTTIPVKLSAPDFSLSEVPVYSGDPYVETNGNKPYFTEYPKEVFELYSPLDELGRCGTAYANICKEIMPTEKRGEIGSVKPTGWHTANYSGIIEDIYLYNRCHLIGYQLAGENANERNLITGTRYMNVEGMEPFESRIANYVKTENAHVLYRVTPVFEGNNLLAAGVLMEAYSLEDAGKGIQFCIFCYNVQPGIGINYADGDSWALPQEPETPTNNTGQQTGTYVLNTNTHKFHIPSCPSVETMSEKNKAYHTGTRDEVIAMGYEPCKRCHP